MLARDKTVSLADALPALCRPFVGAAERWELAVGQRQFDRIDNSGERVDARSPARRSSRTVSAHASA
jgi:hypothetical protein